MIFFQTRIQYFFKSFHDLFEKKIGQFTNDFLNKIEEGKAGTKQFQEAKEDAELDIMRDALSGKLGEEEYKAIVRRIARWALEGNREKRNIYCTN